MSHDLLLIGIRIAGPELQRRLGPVDELASLGRVILGQQPAFRDTHEIRIGVVPLAIGVRQFHRFSQ